MGKRRERERETERGWKRERSTQGEEREIERNERMR